MARAALPISKFTLADGSALSNGYALVQLNRDAQSGDSQVCAAIIVRVELDDTGAPIGSPTFPTNDTMNPSGTVYLLSAYTEDGAVVYQYMPVSISVPPVVGGFGTAFGSAFGS